MAYDIVFSSRIDERGIRRQLQNLSRHHVSIGGLDGRGFSQPLGRIRGQLGEFDKSLEASNARVIAFGASAGAIYALNSAMREMVKSTIEVEAALANINVILGLSKENLEEFGQSLFSAASETGQSWRVAAEAAAELARQGLGVNETLKRMTDSLILSRIAGYDATSALQAITAILNSFNKSALTSTEVVNKLAAVDAKFAVSAGDLAEAVKRVGSSATDVGVSFEELISLVTAAQQITARGGSVIGNSFKTIFTRLQRPRVLDALAELGVQVKNLEGGFRPTIAILEELSRKFDNLGQSQQAQIAELVGGVFQINILKATLADLSQEYSVFGSALDAANTATNEASVRNKELNQTLSAQANKSLNTVTKFGSEIGKLTFAPAAEKLLTSIQSAFSTENKGIFDSLSRSLFAGLGKAISGPGISLLTLIGFQLAKRLTGFIYDAAQEVSGLTSQKKKQELIEQTIVKFLQHERDISGDINQIHRKILETVTRERQEMEIMQKIAKSLSPSLLSAGVRVSKGVSSTGLELPSEKRKYAEGFTPLYSSGLVPNLNASEIAGAKAGGYAAMGTKEISLGNQRAVINSREKIRYIGGFEQPFISPPEFTPAGAAHKREAVEKTGINPYLYARGLVPEQKGQKFAEGEMRRIEIRMRQIKYDEKVSGREISDDNLREYQSLKNRLRDIRRQSQEEPPRSYAAGFVPQKKQTEIYALLNEANKSFEDVIDNVSKIRGVGRRNNPKALDRQQKLGKLFERGGGDISKVKFSINDFLGYAKSNFRVINKFQGGEEEFLGELSKITGSRDPNSQMDLSQAFQFIGKHGLGTEKFDSFLNQKDATGQRRIDAAGPVIGALRRSKKPGRGSFLRDLIANYKRLSSLDLTMKNFGVAVIKGKGAPQVLGISGGARIKGIQNIGLNKSLVPSSGELDDLVSEPISQLLKTKIDQLLGRSDLIDTATIKKRLVEQSSGFSLLAGRFMEQAIYTMYGLPSPKSSGIDIRGESLDKVKADKGLTSALFTNPEQIQKLKGLELKYSLGDARDSLEKKIKKIILKPEEFHTFFEQLYPSQKGVLEDFLYGITGKIDKAQLLTKELIPNLADQISVQDINKFFNPKEEEKIPMISRSTIEKIFLDGNGIRKTGFSDISAQETKTILDEVFQGKPQGNFEEVIRKVSGPFGLSVADISALSNHPEVRKMFFDREYNTKTKKMESKKKGIFKGKNFGGIKNLLLARFKGNETSLEKVTGRQKQDLTTKEQKKFQSVIPTLDGSRIGIMVGHSSNFDGNRQFLKSFKVQGIQEIPVQRPEGKLKADELSSEIPIILSNIIGRVSQNFPLDVKKRINPEKFNPKYIHNYLVGKGSVGGFDIGEFSQQLGLLLEASILTPFNIRQSGNSIWDVSVGEMQKMKGETKLLNTMFGQNASKFAGLVVGDVKTNLEGDTTGKLINKINQTIFRKDLRQKVFPEITSDKQANLLLSKLPSVAKTIYAEQESAYQQAFIRNEGAIKEKLGIPNLASGDFLKTFRNPKKMEDFHKKGIIHAIGKDFYNEDEVELRNLESTIRGHGYASEFMRHLTDTADKTQTRVNLVPVASESHRPGALNQEQLEEFYKRHGFDIEKTKYGQTVMRRSPRKFASGLVPRGQKNFDKISEFLQGSVKKPLETLSRYDYEDAIKYLDSESGELNRDLKEGYLGGAFPFGRKKTSSLARLLKKKGFRFNRGLVPDELISAGGYGAFFGTSRNFSGKRVGYKDFRYRYSNEGIEQSKTPEAERQIYLEEEFRNSRKLYDAVQAGALPEYLTAPRTIGSLPASLRKQRIYKEVEQGRTISELLHSRRIGYGPKTSAFLGSFRDVVHKDLLDAGFRPDFQHGFDLNDDNFVLNQEAQDKVAKLLSRSRTAELLRKSKNPEKLIRKRLSVYGQRGARFSLIDPQFINYNGLVPNFTEAEENRQSAIRSLGYQQDIKGVFDKFGLQPIGVGGESLVGAREKSVVKFPIPEIESTVRGLKSKERRTNKANEYFSRHQLPLNSPKARATKLGGKNVLVQKRVQGIPLGDVLGSIESISLLNELYSEKLKISENEEPNFSTPLIDTGVSRNFYVRNEDVENVRKMSLEYQGRNLISGLKAKGIKLQAIDLFRGNIPNFAGDYSIPSDPREQRELIEDLARETKLRFREEEVLRQRLSGESYKGIGKKFKVGQNQIRNYEAKGIRKLSREGAVNLNLKGLLNEGNIPNFAEGQNWHKVLANLDAKLTNPQRTEPLSISEIQRRQRLPSSFEDFVFGDGGKRGEVYLSDGGYSRIYIHDTLDEFHLGGQSTPPVKEAYDKQPKELKVAQRYFKRFGTRLKHEGDVPNLAAPKTVRKGAIYNYAGTQVRVEEVFPDKTAKVKNHENFEETVKISKLSVASKNQLNAYFRKRNEKGQFGPLGEKFREKNFGSDGIVPNYALSFGALRGAYETFIGGKKTKDNTKKDSEKGIKTVRGRYGKISHGRGVEKSYAQEGDVYIPQGSSGEAILHEIGHVFAGRAGQKGRLEREISANSAATALLQKRGTPEDLEYYKEFAREQVKGYKINELNYGLLKIKEKQNNISPIVQEGDAIVSGPATFDRLKEVNAGKSAKLRELIQTVGVDEAKKMIRNTKLPPKYKALFAHRGYSDGMVPNFANMIGYHATPLDFGNKISSNRSFGKGQGKGFYAFRDKKDAEEHLKFIEDASFGTLPKKTIVAGKFNQDSLVPDYEIHRKQAIDFLNRNRNLLSGLKPSKAPVIDREGYEYGTISGASVSDKAFQIESSLKTGKRKSSFSFDTTGIEENYGGIAYGQKLGPLFDALREQYPREIRAFELDLLKNNEGRTAFRYTGPDVKAYKKQYALGLVPNLAGFVGQRFVSESQMLEAFVTPTIKGTPDSRRGMERITFFDLNERRPIGHQVINEEVVKAYGSDLAPFLSEETRHHRGKWKRLAYSGLIPNFNAVQDAISREISAGYSKSQVKVGKDLRLKTQSNPLGLGVFNTSEGNLNKAISIHRRMGKNSSQIKSAGLKHKGQVPNFQTGAGADIGIGLLFGFQSLLEGLQGGSKIEKQQRRLEDANSKLIKNIEKHAAAINKIESEMGKSSSKYRTVADADAARLRTIDSLKRSAGRLSVAQDDTTKVLRRNQEVIQKQSRNRRLLFAASTIFPTVSGIAGNLLGGQESRAGRLADDIGSIGYQTLALKSAAPEGGVIAKSIIALGVARTLNATLNEFSSSFASLAKRFDTMKEQITKAEEGVQAFAQANELLTQAYKERVLSSNQISRLQDNYAKSLASLPNELKQIANTTSNIQDFVRLSGQFLQEQKTNQAQLNVAAQIQEKLDSKKILGVPFGSPFGKLSKEINQKNVKDFGQQITAVATKPLEFQQRLVETGPSVATDSDIFTRFITDAQEAGEISDELAGSLRDLASEGIGTEGAFRLLATSMYNSSLITLKVKSNLDGLNKAQKTQQKELDAIRKSSEYFSNKVKTMQNALVSFTGSQIAFANAARSARNELRGNAIEGQLSYIEKVFNGISDKISPLAKIQFEGDFQTLGARSEKSQNILSANDQQISSLFTSFRSALEKSDLKDKDPQRIAGISKDITGLARGAEGKTFEQVAQALEQYIDRNAQLLGGDFAFAEEIQKGREEIAQRTDAEIRAYDKKIRMIQAETQAQRVLLESQRAGGFFGGAQGTNNPSVYKEDFIKLLKGVGTLSAPFSQSRTAGPIQAAGVKDLAEGLKGILGPEIFSKQLADGLRPLFVEGRTQELQSKVGGVKELFDTALSRGLSPQQKGVFQSVRREVTKLQDPNFLRGIANEQFNDLVPIDKQQLVELQAIRDILAGTKSGISQQEGLSKPIIRNSIEDLTGATFRRDLTFKQAQISSAQASATGFASVSEFQQEAFKVIGLASAETKDINFKRGITDDPSSAVIISNLEKIANATEAQVPKNIRNQAEAALKSIDTFNKGKFLDFINAGLKPGSIHVHDTHLEKLLSQRDSLGTPEVSSGGFTRTLAQGAFYGGALGLGLIVAKTVNTAWNAGIKLAKPYITKSVKEIFNGIKNIRTEFPKYKSVVGERIGQGIGRAGASINAFEVKGAENLSFGRIAERIFGSRPSFSNLPTAPEPPGLANILFARQTSGFYNNVFRLPPPDTTTPYSTARRLPTPRLSTPQVPFAPKPVLPTGGAGQALRTIQTNIGLGLNTSKLSKQKIDARLVPLEKGYKAGSLTPEEVVERYVLRSKAKEISNIPKTNILTRGRGAVGAAGSVADKAARLGRLDATPFLRGGYGVQGGVGELTKQSLGAAANVGGKIGRFGLGLAKGAPAAIAEIGSREYAERYIAKKYGYGKAYIGTRAAGIGAATGLGAIGLGGALATGGATAALAAGSAIALPAVIGAGIAYDTYATDKRTRRDALFQAGAGRGDYFSNRANLGRSKKEREYFELIAAQEEILKSKSTQVVESPYNSKFYKGLSYGTGLIGLAGRVFYNEDERQTPVGAKEQSTRTASAVRLALGDNKYKDEDFIDPNSRYTEKVQERLAQRRAQLEAENPYLLQEKALREKQYEQSIALKDKIQGKYSKLKSLGVNEETSQRVALGTFAPELQQSLGKKTSYELDDYIEKTGYEGIIQGLTNKASETTALNTQNKSYQSYRETLANRQEIFATEQERVKNDPYLQHQYRLQGRYGAEQRFAAVKQNYNLARRGELGFTDEERQYNYENITKFDEFASDLRGKIQSGEAYKYQGKYYEKPKATKFGKYEATKYERPVYQGPQYDVNTGQLSQGRFIGNALPERSGYNYLQNNYRVNRPEESYTRPYSDQRRQDSGADDFRNTITQAGQEFADNIRAAISEVQGRELDPRTGQSKDTSAVTIQVPPIDLSGNIGVDLKGIEAASPELVTEVYNKIVAEITRQVGNTIKLTPIPVSQRAGGQKRGRR